MIGETMEHAASIVLAPLFERRLQVDEAEEEAEAAEEAEEEAEAEVVIISGGL